jgi:hypothetical protein
MESGVNMGPPGHQKLRLMDSGGRKLPEGVGHEGWTTVCHIIGRWFESKPKRPNHKLAQFGFGPKSGLQQRNISGYCRNILTASDWARNAAGQVTVDPPPKGLSMRAQ